MTTVRAMLLLVIVAVLLAPVTATADWRSGDVVATTVRATTVLRPAAPVVEQAGSQVRVTWTPSTLGTGRPADGYQVLRRVGGGATVACVASADQLGCVDPEPSGDVAAYSVVATFGPWRSAESPAVMHETDDTPPVTTASQTPAPNASGWATGEVTVHLSAVDDSGVAGLAFRVGSGPWSSASGSTASVPVSAGGVTVVEFTATDVHGNKEQLRSHTVRIDPDPPRQAPTGLRILEDTGASSSDGVTQTATLTVAGRAPAGSSVLLRRGSTVVATVTTAPDGSFSARLPVLPGDAVHTFTATVVNAVGNESPGTELVVRLDRTAPGGAVRFPTAGGTYKKGQAKSGCSGQPWSVQDAVCGVASDAAYTAGLSTAQITVRRGSDGSCWTGSVGGFSQAACTQPPTVPIVGSSNPAWSAVVGSAPGSYVMTVTLKDLAGNQTTLAPVPFTFE